MVRRRFVQRSRLVSGVLAAASVLAWMVAWSPPASAVVSPSQQWMTSAGPNITGPGQTMNIGFGTSGVTAALDVTSGTNIPPGAWPTDLGAPLTSFGPNVTPFIEPDPPANADSIAQGTPIAPGGSQSSVVTFNKPVIGPILHVVNLDGSYVDIGGTTTTGAPIAVTPLARNNELVITGNRLNSDQDPAVVGGCELDDTSNPNGSCGSLQMGPGSPVVQSFTMNNVGIADTWEWSLSFPTAPLTKQFSPNRIPDGGVSALTFTIDNPTNPGQVTLTPLDFTDALPAGVTLADGTVSNNGHCGGSPSVTDSGGGGLGAGDTGVKASNISVAVGETCTITINVTSHTPGNYVNDNNNLSTGVANLIPNASTPLEVYPAVDLELSKTASPTPAVPGTNETYSLVVKNNGPSAAQNVKATDKLPSGLSFVSASPDCTQATGTVTCSLASLAAGASHTFTVTGHIASSVNSCSDLQNNAAVTNDIVDTNLTNNSASVCPPPEGKVDLKITKDPSRTGVPVGGQVIYTLVVTNKGPSDDTGVKVSDPLPAGLKLVSVDPSQGSCSTSGASITCSLGTLRAGGSAQILLTAEVTGTASGAGCIGSNSVTNAVSVTGDKTEINTSDNDDSSTICVTPGPDPKFDLVVDKTANHSTITAGKTVTYTIVEINKGPDAAPSADLVDTFNARGTVVSVKTTQGSCTKVLPLNCSFGTIPAGGKVTITVVVRPQTTGCKERNAVSVTAAGTDTNPANNLDTVDLCVKVTLRLSKVADSTSVTAGGTIHYTIRATNPSKYEVRNVSVCDTLPSGLSYVSSTPRAKLSKGRQCWTISSLKAHKSKTFKLTVRALNGASGSKTNRVTASGDGIRTKHAKRSVHVLGKKTQPPIVTG
jgi:uncharacterized repeat protein (TIGR01451 family)